MTNFTDPCLSKASIKPVWLLAVAFFLPFTASAAPTNTLFPGMDTATGLKATIDLQQLNMSQAVKRAVEWNPVVTGANERLNEQGQAVAVAQSAYYPKIQSGIKSSYRDSTGHTEEALTVSGSQLLYDFGKVASNVEASRFGEKVYEADSLRVVDQLVRETAFAVIEVQRYQELLTIAKEQVTGVVGLYDLAKKRAEMGASTRSDVLQAQSRRESAQAYELQMQGQLDMWKRILQNLIGTSTPSEVVPGTPVGFDQACSVDMSSLSNVPEVMVADARRSEAIANIKASEAAFYPTITLDAGLEHYLKERERNFRHNDRNDYTVGLNVTVDLYQGGATTARKRGAEYALRAADAAKDEALLGIARGLQEAQSLVVTYNQRLSILDNRVVDIIETQKLYRQQYISLGTRSLLDLLNTEQEIHQSRMEKVNAEQDLTRLQIDCLYNTANLRSAFALNNYQSVGSY